VTRFCPRCGERLPGPPPTCCSACSYALFVNPRPTGSVVIVDDGRFLVVRRAHEPHAGLWDLPGGFCDGWEHPEQAAVREAREELGVEVRLDRFIGMYIGSYAFQDELLPVLDSFWLATIVSGEITLDPAEATAFMWTDLADPPQMAFPTMDAALKEVALRCFG
jgi:ADP-ribose pyrophosphatase YjhB (NUDIX family)